MKLGLACVPSPIGEIELVFDQDALLALEFADRNARTRSWLARRYGPVELATAPEPLGSSPKHSQLHESVS